MAQRVSGDSSAPGGSGEKDEQTRPSGVSRKRSVAEPAFSLPVTLLMVTLIVVGLIGTVRMRNHALERQKPALQSATAGTVFTTDQLAMYDGRGGRGPIYIGILGQVFDVTAGKQHYGPGGSYEFFAGRDASRAYVTGKFAEDLHDDVRDLSAQDLHGLIEWRSFYRNHKKYAYVGKVAGRLYDARGEAMPLLAMIEMKAAEYAAQQEETKKRESAGLMPKTCSFRWHRDTGGRVSCDEGFPRRVYDEEKKRDICRCMSETSVNATVRAYDGCPVDAMSCRTKKQRTEDKDTKEL